MKNRLIIAAAGSGKTTFIVKEALSIKDKRVLITTFTEANANEINKKFYELNECIPGNITIQTLFSLLLEHGVKPFQGVLTDKKITGILLVNQRSGLKYQGKGFPVYWGEDNFDKYYFTEDNRVYTDKLAKLVVRCNEKSEGLVLSRLTNLYSNIFIDEIQDLAGYDLEIIKLLLQSKSSVLMVGDPRQVTYHTHDESKYVKYTDGNIVDFVKFECRSISCNIDFQTLNSSFRNNQLICDFSSKLYSNFPTCSSVQRAVTGHDGVFLIKESDVNKYLFEYKPMQLRDSISTEVNNKYKAMNFGNSKGTTFDRVIIYPTKPMINWLKDNDSELKPPSRAKFYVALTRAKYSVAIIMNYTNKTNIDGAQKFSF